MATVKLPNGATIKLPDKNASADVAASVGRAVAGAAPKTAALAKIEEVMSPGAFGEAVAQGASFGFSDEISSALASLSGRDYDTELRASRDRMSDYRERNPAASFAGELLGGIAVPGIGFNAAMRATTLPGKIAGLVGAGALAGGLTGAGVGEGGEDRLEKAGWGALTGGVAAPVLVGAANALGRGYNALLDVTGLGSTARAETLANRKVLQALERAGFSADDAAAELARMKAAGADPALMDLGQMPARLTATAARVPGQGAEIAADFVEGRQLAQGDRIASVVDDLFGTNKSAAAFVDELNNTQKAAAKPLYDAASGVNIKTDDLVPFINNPEFRRALREGARITALETRDDAITKIDWNAALDRLPTEMPTRWIDLAKRGLDARIKATRISNPTLSRALGQFQRDLLATVDNLNPQYAAARAQWAGAMALEDAVEAGKDAITRQMDPDALAALYNGLSPAEQPAFRIGVVDALKKMIRESADGRNKVLALFGTPARRQRLEAILGRDNFAKLSEFMGFEKAASKAQGKVAGNSLTAERLADDADRAKDGVDLLASAITSPRYVLGNLARKAIGYTQGLNEQTAAQIVSKMTENDPGKIKALIELLKSFAAKDAARMANPLRGGATYGVGVGGVAAPMGLLGN